MKKQRYIREELGSDEELAVFDLLTKPDMDLNQKQIKQVKAVAKKTIKNSLQTEMVLDWKKKQQTRAGVKVAIEEVLDGLQSVCSRRFLKANYANVYNYVWELDS